MICGPTGPLPPSSRRSIVWTPHQTSILCRGILSDVRGDVSGFYDDAAFFQIEHACPAGHVLRSDPLFATLRPLMQRIEPQSANKVVRTAFLRASGLQFPNGHFFEDMFFHTGLLSSAQSVAFAYSPCFTYFRRYIRPQITATSSDRRFDAIAVTKLTLESFARTLEFHDAAEPDRRAGVVPPDRGMVRNHRSATSIARPFARPCAPFWRGLTRCI